MVQTTFRINASFEKKLDSVKGTVEQKVKDRLEDIAHSLAELSPVDTGAYATSHSFKANNTRSRGRGRSSHNRPHNQDPIGKRMEGLAQMLEDINGVDIEGLEKATFRNDSPHARLVEDGWPTKAGYAVYRTTRDRFG